MKLQGLDSECGIWLYCTKIEERDGKSRVKWDGYNTTTWLHACEVRQPQTKRPLRRKPKRVDWPTLRSPENLQRYDVVSVLRDDGSYGERLIVYINDPYNGNVITACRQTLRYELIVECASEQHAETMDDMPTPTSPRSPSPPPPFVPEAVEEQASPVPCSPLPPPLVPDVGAASTSRTSSSATTQSRSGVKRKSSTTTVKKQAAKMICFGRPESRICHDIPSTEESGDEEDTQGDQPEYEVPEVPDKYEEEIKELKKTLTDFINESNKNYATLLSKYCNLEREVKEIKKNRADPLEAVPVDAMTRTPVRVPLGELDLNTPPPRPSESPVSEPLKMSLSVFANNPNEVGRRLAKFYFSDEERAERNCNGIGKPAFGQHKLPYLRKDLFSIVQTPLQQHEAVWKQVTKALDAEMRSKSAYMKKKLMLV